MCHFEKLSEWTERLETLCRMASDGFRITDMLVLSPVGAVWAEYANKDLPIDTSKPYRYEDLFRENSLTESLSEVAVSYRILEENLMSLGFDFHLGNERLLSLSARLSEGGLCVGEYTYHTVVLPDGFVPDGSTVKLLSDFARRGGRLLFAGKRPRSITGEDVFSDLWDEGLLRPLSKRREECGHQLTSYGVRSAFAFSDVPSGKRADGVLFTARRTETCTRIFVRNTWPVARQLSVSFGGKEYFFGLAGNGYAVLTMGEKTTVYRPVENTYEPLLSVPTVADTQHLPLSCRYHTESPNVLVLDTCTALTDDGRRASGYFLHVNEAVYRGLSGVHRVTVEYTFIAAEVPDRLSVAAESGEELEGVYLNGTKLSPTGETYVTEDFSVYAAKGLAVVGENRVTLVYRIDTTDLSPMVEAFETESNVYFRKTELECVFVLGDFSVRYDGSLSCRRGREYRVMENLRLYEGKPIKEADAPFYRGRVVYDGTFTVPYLSDTDEKLFLSVANSYPVLTVSVNGTAAVTSFGGYMDVTGLVRAGENRLHIVAYTRNRNLFGPHHYFNLDNEYVGPSVFAGRRGWEDRSNAEVPFACVPVNTFVPHMSVVKEELSGYVTLYAVHL